MTRERPSHVPDPTGYTRETALTSLDYVANQLANDSDEAFDAGDDTTAGHHAHEANAVAFAAAELRKTCAGCKHWSGVKWPDHGGHHRCMHAEVTYMPYDGSGFCHRYEVK